MSNTRPAKAWNILDCGLSRGVTGHHYWEAKAFADELVRRGQTVRLFANKRAPDAGLFAGAEIVPTFTMFLYQSVSNDPVWSTIENFVIHNRSFHHDLSRLDPSLFEDSVTLFPTTSENQILGIVRWLATFPRERRPRVAVGLKAPQEFSPSNARLQFYRSIFKTLVAEGGPGIAVFSRTPQCAAMFTKHIGVPTNVFPYLAPDDLISRQPRAAAAPRGPMVVSFVGGARRERGGALLPDVVKRCAGSGVQFFIQVRGEADPEFDPNTLRALSDQPHVRLQNGAMTREDYYTAIADSVVLLAYRASDYRWRDSGVYHEAKMLDSPVLVTAGTWMEDEVQSFGNGLVIEDFTTDAIVECIMRAQRELPALRAAAVRMGRDARKKNGVARCLEAFANAVQGPGAV